MGEGHWATFWIILISFYTYFNSFIWIKFTCHTIHPFKMYNPLMDILCEYINDEHIFINICNHQLKEKSYPLNF